jgi:hypothetical protein
LDAWESKGSDISFEGGKVGIGTDQPQTTLDVNGGVRVGRFTTATRPVCNDTIVGTFIFDTDKKKPFVCDGSLWKPLDSDYDEDGIVDWNDENDNDPLLKDEQLKSENIKTGVEIFGVDGSYTNDATSVASDVKNGKWFYAGGQKIVGNMTVYETDQQAALVSNSDGRLKFRVPAGYFDGSLDVFGVDGDLVSGNIKEGVEIFGVTGNLISEIGIKGEVLISISGIQFFGYSIHSRSCYRIREPLNTIHLYNNTYYFISLLDYGWNCSKENQTWWIIGLIGKYSPQNNIDFIETNKISYYESDGYGFGQSSSDGGNYIKVCNGNIYFIKRLLDWDTREPTYYWLVFNTSSNSFSKGSSSNYPCESDSNNEVLIINGVHWRHKTNFLYTGKSPPAHYIYAMWLTSGNQ